MKRQKKESLSPIIQWNHTRKIASVISAGTKEASIKAKEISDTMVKVKDGVLIEENRNGEIRKIRNINTVPVNKRTITLHIKKES